MKVKIFKHWDSTFMEDQMNKWFDENPNIKIVTMKQSSGMSGHDNLHTVITIIYNKTYRKQDTDHVKNKRGYIPFYFII